MTIHTFRPEDLPTWALRTELPTIVRETCETAQQISVWMAIRWLLAVRQRRALGLGSREVAERAKVNVKTVTGTVQDLVRLGLLSIVGHEKVGGKSRPIYHIPRSIEEENAAFTWKFIAHYTVGSAPVPHEDQLSLPLGDAPEPLPRDPKTDHGGDPKTDHEIAIGDPKTDHGGDPKTDRRDPKTDHGGDPKTDHLEGRKDHGKEGGSRARAEKRKPGRPPNTPPPLTPPEPPPGAYALPRHPIVQWQDACPNHRPADVDQLLALAAEHDESTAGHGLYWTGRAILAASLVEDVRQVGKIKRIMTRWRDQASYGSDLPLKETPHGRATTGARRGPATVDARPGEDRAPRGERGPVRSKLEY